MKDDDHARQVSFCLGCGQHKQPGLVVCWDCFKYREDRTPLKYFGGSFADWVRHVNHSGESIPLS